MARHDEWAVPGWHDPFWHEARWAESHLYPDASVLLTNRAQVNLLLGNHRRALDDAGRAVQLSSSNVKAYYWATKAAIALGLLPEAASFCRRRLEQDLTNEELKKLLAQGDAQQSEQDRHRAKVA